MRLPDNCIVLREIESWSAPPVGREQPRKLPGKTAPVEKSGANRGAPAPTGLAPLPLPDDLARVVTSWPHLSPAEKAVIMALVDRERH
jgi:hypothetical protein